MAAKKSTNVRSLNLAFGLLERIAPAVGVRMLNRLWFRVPAVPPTIRRPRGEIPAPTPFEVGAIRGQSYGDGPPIYLVHGWGGWGLQLAAHIQPLVDAGFRVIAYDAPSHGDSAPGREGKGESTLLELADALKAVVAAQGPAYGVIAHSLGAPATALALRDGLEVERVVFIATATDFTETLDQMEAFLGFGPRIRSGFLRRFAARFGPMDSFRMDAVIPEMAARRPLPPLLLIHDRSDTETSYQGSAEVAARWPGARLETSEGLGHRRVLRDPDLVKKAVVFLAERAPADRRSGRQERMRG
ncbi:alpha/beta hydrolase family protein [Kribbella steppae]|uniref:Alpha/beta hydrolase family protein n=1 Tax=Kribbella steppae TaxID=2512223 RepID=A0A4R2HEB2_9ACTN|nr:alpha/beta fold hydrolase [Kribbella steppae]TCO26344.1 alpha/beta hydrolase family protein [Kribbella steppae]